MSSLAVLGATGSIGAQTLDIARKFPERFTVKALVARSNADKLFELAREFRPEVCGLAEEPKAIPAELKRIDWVFGADASVKALQRARPDDAVCAMVGIAGLPAVMAALKYARRVLLANKEALVTGGRLVMDEAKRLNVPIIPLDSEHSAIYQCLRAAEGNAPERLILTCSGGALRHMSAGDIARARVTDVLKHPTWRMGGKITVDCATLFNKGLEVIEAHYLFGMPNERIDVVVHPESVIHSMVQFADGAVLAQLGAPDMRAPITYALGAGARLDFGGARLNFARVKSLSFEPPDAERFPCLGYAREALDRGGTLPVVLNGVNELAVSAFLRGEIPFGAIQRLLKAALDDTGRRDINSVQDVYEADARAREWAANKISSLYGG